MGNFYMEPSDSFLTEFSDSNNLTILIKNNTSFKGKGSCTDLILANRKFEFPCSYETGINEHHHMIYTVSKSFHNTEPKFLNYRLHKHFSQEDIKEEHREAA